jgi:hypothetical protein
MRSNPQLGARLRRYLDAAQRGVNRVWRPSWNESLLNRVFAALEVASIIRDSAERWAKRQLLRLHPNGAFPPRAFDYTVRTICERGYDHYVWCWQRWADVRRWIEGNPRGLPDLPLDPNVPDLAPEAQ